ncbi:MAG TPA: hypothetical protein VM469_10055 [Pseudoxanthomonas sp.]|jgi:hypothetical protein|nr:hypothetical protein [Pseudoxanthomonas sp.]
MSFKPSHAVGISVGALLTVALLRASARAQEYHETAVPNQQIAAVLRDVVQWHDGQHPECKFERSLGSEPGKSSDGEPEEHWSIAACRGQTFTYRVSVISQSQGGGITVLVGNLNRHPIGDSAGQGTPDLAASCQAFAARLAVMEADSERDLNDSTEQARHSADSAALQAEISACKEKGLLPAGS